MQVGLSTIEEDGIRTSGPVVRTVPFRLDRFGPMLSEEVTEMLQDGRVGHERESELLEAERVTCAAGVPTIWNLLYQALKEQPYDLSSLHTILVGGAAASRTMMENFERDFGIRVLHAWGMTETSPIGTVSRLKSAMESWTEEEQLEVRLKQGIPVAGVEARILGERDEDLPRDGQHSGELVVRGPWIS